MDPKQTAPQGGVPAGGQEGQNGSGAPAVAPAPVFSTAGSIKNSEPSVTSANEPGTLGAETLSTGANVSNAMDSLNSNNQASQDGLAFAKQRFDKIDPGTGDIILTPDNGPKKRSGLFSGFLGGSRQKPAAAETGSVSMIENRHQDVVIPEEFQNRPPEKKSRRGLVVAIIAIVAVAAIAGIVALIVLSNGQGNNRSSSNASNTGDTGSDAIVSETIAQNATLFANKKALEQLSAQYNNIDWLESIIISVYNGNISSNNYQKIKEPIRQVLAELENLRLYLSKNNISLDNSSFMATLTKRLPVYKELISALTTVTEYEQSASAITSQDFNTLTELDNTDLRLVLNNISDQKQQGILTKFVLSTDYETISKIAYAIAEPFDYNNDGYLAGLINILTTGVTNEN